MDADVLAAFEVRLATAATEVEHTLGALLADEPLTGEAARPARLMQAMRHAALGGGKRLRPFLAIEAARLFGPESGHALRAGTAIELVHCYSLVHDDLPSMDDDDLRRGRPTVHRAFDEATAILAGDALLTMAFDVMADEATHPSAAVRCALVSGLARASGCGGMVGGQMLDLAAEGRYGTASLGLADIRALQAMKTGALIGFSVRAGALCGGAGADDIAALGRYAQAIGAAFQVADDILDHESDAETMGKRTGKDAGRGKGTLVGMLGLPGAKAHCAELVGQAHAALERFGASGDVLRQTARFIAARKA